MVACSTTRRKAGLAPIIFVLDRDGVIKAKLYEDTFTKRPPVKLVIETLDKLAAKTPSTAMEK